MAKDHTPYLGFWDADLATPLNAVNDFCRELDEKPEVQWVFGSRVKLLGREIHRNERRHYIGRIFATAVSMMLGLAVYDTQCGAKLFRANPDNLALLAEPFHTRWLFDVEIIARMIRTHRSDNGSTPEQIIYELPLNQWRDVPGSKGSLADGGRAAFQLWKIYNHYLSRGN